MLPSFFSWTKPFFKSGFLQDLYSMSVTNYGGNVEDFQIACIAG